MKERYISHYEDSTLYYGHSVKYQLTQNTFYPHSHDVYEIIFYKRGDITYVVNSKKYRLKRNDLVISRPFDIHLITSESECDYERYCILFDDSILPSEIIDKLPENTDVINFEYNSTVLNLFDKMDYYCEHLSGSTLKAILNNLIAEVMVNVVLESGCADAYDRNQANTLVGKAIDYIDSHLLSIESIEEICSELYITKSHLHHLFMKHLHISPKKYISAKRLHLAQREMAIGGKPTEIYLKYGFSDYSAFYRAYVKYFGYRPSYKSTSAHAVSTRLELLTRAGE